MLLKPILASLGAVVLWGVAPAFVKPEISHLPESYFLMVRFFLSTLFLLPTLRSIRFQSLQQRPTFCLILLVISGVHFQTQLMALKILPVSWYVIFFALTPAITLLLLRVTWTLNHVLGLVTATSGLLFFVGQAPGAISWLGVGLQIVSLVAWALLTLILARTTTQFSNAQATAIFNLAGFMSSLFYWLISGAPTAPLTSGSWVAIGIMGLGMPLAFFLFTFAVREVPRLAITNQFLEPVFGVSVGFIYLGESLSNNQLVGAALIILSSTYFALAERSRPEPRRPQQTRCSWPPDSPVESQ